MLSTGEIAAIASCSLLLVVIIVTSIICITKRNRNDQIAEQKVAELSKDKPKNIQQESVSQHAPDESNRGILNSKHKEKESQSEVEKSENLKEIYDKKMFELQKIKESMSVSRLEIVNNDQNNIIFKQPQKENEWLNKTLRQADIADFNNDNQEAEFNYQYSDRSEYNRQQVLEEAIIKNIQKSLNDNQENEEIVKTKSVITKRKGSQLNNIRKGVTLSKYSYSKSIEKNKEGMIANVEKTQVKVTANDKISFDKLNFVVDDKNSSEKKCSVFKSIIANHLSIDYEISEESDSEEEMDEICTGVINVSKFNDIEASNTQDMLKRISVHATNQILDTSIADQDMYSARRCIELSILSNIEHNDEESIRKFPDRAQEF